MSHAVVMSQLTSKQFVGVLVVVLVRKDLRPHIGDVATDAVPVGLMGLMVSLP